ncbi:spheroidene monooxygenase [uncultured Tateyamaria sp.]|uniref:spheroidene monooxygenase n=1 Tax=uncultured Tateyamaria sp. TaxID=455651 RepID=UPI0026032F17|nr:spheroidene monooxygenase [uncultured Tateyamaria sp.]
MSQTTTISFFRFARWRDRAWALTMMGAARLAMARVPDLGFWKLCGSGTGEGFTPVPNTAVYAILCTWPDEETARRRIESTPIFERYRTRATEHWTIFLAPTSARGAWSGKTPFFPVSEPKTGPSDKPLAALTRATIKPGILTKFWGRVPDISAMIGSDPNVLFKIGIGEVPMLHQVTFSIWPGAQEMAQFARTNGPHADAIKAVRDGAWFREELYARFAILGDSGTWGGTSPLEGLRLQ